MSASGARAADRGLPARPAVDPAVLAVVAAAAEQLLRPPVVVSAAADERHTAWRFSGRWWAKPLPVRRDRP